MASKSASTLVLIMLLTTAAAATGAGWAPDFPIGSSIIPINALDQHEQPPNLENLKGAKGLLLLFNRSTTW